VAEHFVARALMLAKKMKQGDIAVRQGNWKARYELIGTELWGKTLGVLGFGRIGQQTARICHYGFSMPVIYYDVISYPEAEAELKAVRTHLERGRRSGGAQELEDRRCRRGCVRRGAYPRTESVLYRGQFCGNSAHGRPYQRGDDPDEPGGAGCFGCSGGAKPGVSCSRDLLINHLTFYKIRNLYAESDHVSSVMQRDGRLRDLRLCLPQISVRCIRGDERSWLPAAVASERGEMHGLR
jgi:hypothetical protein